MVIEIYVSIKIIRSYHGVRPYSNLYHNKRYVSKMIRPYSK